MNIIVSIIVIGSAFYLYLKNKPSGGDSMCIFGIVIVSGLVCAANSFDFSAFIPALLSVSGIVCMAFLLCIFKVQIALEQAEERARRRKRRIARRKFHEALRENESKVVKVDFAA